MALCLLYSRLSPSKALCPLFSPLSYLLPSVSSSALISSMALCLLQGPPSSLGPLFSLVPSVSSTALFPSMTICPLWSPVSSLRPSVPCMALCSSTAFCPLYNPLSPLRPSVLSMALCPLWKQRNKRNDPLVSRNVLQNAFRQNSKGYRNLFCISDNRDYRYIHNYHSSEILSDNRKIAIIALAKKVAIIAIITSKRSNNRLSRKIENAISYQPQLRIWIDPCHFASTVDETSIVGPDSDPIYNSEIFWFLTSYKYGHRGRQNRGQHQHQGCTRKLSRPFENHAVESLIRIRIKMVLICTGPGCI